MISFLSILVLFTANALAKQAQVYLNREVNKLWRLDNFNKELFWEEPPEGKQEYCMYNELI
jgi:hypothetical protein